MRICRIIWRKKGKREKGTFVFGERQDILTTAIEKPEHPGRVRGVGSNVGIQSYFGGRSRRSTTLSSISSAVLLELTQNITKEVTSNLKKELGLSLKSNGDNSYSTPVQLNTHNDACFSAKGSCTDATNPSRDGAGIGISPQISNYLITSLIIYC